MSTSCPDCGVREGSLHTDGCTWRKKRENDMDGFPDNLSDAANPLRQWGRDNLSMYRRLKEGRLLDSSSNSNGVRDVLVERAKAHGKYPLNAEACCSLLATMEPFGFDRLPTTHRYALMMIAAKIARLLQKPNERDHWADIAGYADLVVAEIDALPR